MSFQQPGLMVGNQAASADLSAKQFYGVKFGASGIALCATAGEVCDGVLQDKPESGDVGNVMISGITKAVAGAAVTKGALVAVTAAGKFVTATATDYSVGRAMEAASADGDLIAVLLHSPGQTDGTDGSVDGAIIASGLHTTAGGDANENIVVTGALATDIAIVTLKTVGATPRTILTAAAGEDDIDVVLSGDPSTDHVLQYLVYRPS